MIFCRSYRSAQQRRVTDNSGNRTSALTDVELSYGLDIPRPDILLELLHITADHELAIEHLLPRITIDETLGWAISLLPSTIRRSSTLPTG